MESSTGIKYIQYYLSMYGRRCRGVVEAIGKLGTTSLGYSGQIYRIDSNWRTTARSAVYHGPRGHNSVCEISLYPMRIGCIS